MKLKKFRAANMAEAMEIIKREIGPDAVIMSSRQVKKRRGLFGLFSKKEFEVLAGYEDEPTITFSSAAKNAGLPVRPQGGTSSPSAVSPQGAVSQQTMPLQTVSPGTRTAQAAVQQPAQAPAPAQSAPAAQPAAAATNAQSAEALSQSVNELRVLVERLQQRGPSSEPGPERRFSRAIMDIYRRMIASSVEEATADEICALAEKIVQERGAEPDDVVKNIMVDTLGKPQLIEPVKYQRKTIMLVGPTGVGKTTTLIKLAYMLVYQKNVNIGIINTDSFRVAAQEHMKSYCDILKTDMLTVYRPEEIGEALDAFRSKDVVLIDTVGKVSDDEEYRGDLKKLLEYGDIDDVYLTLSASTSERVLQKLIENYSFLNRYKIIVTKTDEAPYPGVFLYLAHMSGQPLSYATTGQTVPDDIENVNPSRIADSILGVAQS